MEKNCPFSAYEKLWFSSRYIILEAKELYGFVANTAGNGKMRQKRYELVIFSAMGVNLGCNSWELCLK